MSGSLVCVGTGMMLGAHICPLSRSYIEQADVVFVLVSNSLVEAWIGEMNTNCQSLQSFYAEGKNRNKTYNQMAEAMLAEVRAGKKVVGAFYGHPGVFALVPHKAIDWARKEGFDAKMLPGISAEDCLVADLGLDPGKTGCIQFETSQLMFYQRQLDPAALLILWQVGISGDRSLSKFSTDSAKLQILVELLAEHYPLDHQVILYEAAVLPIDDTRIDRIPLRDLPQAQLSQHTTMVVPPCQPMQRNETVLAKLAKLEDKTQLNPA